MRAFSITVSIAVIGFMAGCTTTTPRATTSPKETSPDSPASQLIERTVLWEVELDDTWTPIDMSKLVTDPDLFEQEGNFYKPKTDLVVFGHPATYVGMLGVELIPGFNATLKGKPKDIAKVISDDYGLTFEEREGAYGCDYKEDKAIIIYPHPNLKGQTIVLGAYFGP